MKIVIDARESGTSTGRYIDQLIIHLHQLKPAHQLVVLTKPPRLEFFRSVVPSFEVVRSDYKEFTFSEQIGLARQLYKLKADLVHFNAPQQPLLYSRPSVTTVHDLTTARFANPAKFWPIFKFKQLVYRFVVSRVAHRAKKIIAISNFTKQDLVSFSAISPSKVAVIYEAADKITDKAEPVRGVNPKGFIMYVGRPLPHKNLQRLIEAFVQLQASQPELQLVLAGKKDVLYRRFEDQVKKRGIKNVVFTDFVSEGRLRWLYENTAAYVFPSLSEGFGLPGLEAMVHGAPVVSSKATCLPEIYGQAAHYFNPTDIADMTQKILEVLSDEDLRRALVKKGYAQAAKYSWRRMAEQTLKVYDQALN